MNKQLIRGYKDLSKYILEHHHEDISEASLRQASRRGKDKLPVTWMLGHARFEPAVIDDWVKRQRAKPTRTKVTAVTSA